jgi:probable F420-dependent oxidoreductase
VTAQSNRRDVKASLGRWGVGCYAFNAVEAAEIAPIAGELERRGLRTLWISDSVRGRDPFVVATVLLGATNDLVVAVGVANIYGRDPAAMQIGAHTITDLFGDRFVLGLGVSHQPTLATRGHTSGRPITTMTNYLEAMDGVQFGPRSEAEPVPRLLGALGPKMLELARERTQGTHPYLVTPDHTRRARQLVGPDAVLAPEQTVLIEEQATEARSIARGHLRRYLMMPNYRRNVLTLGFGEEDLADGGSDRLIDALVLWGSAEKVVARAREHHTAGADHVALLPIGERTDQILADALALTDVVAAIDD